MENIISKAPEEMTDEEFEELKKAIRITQEYLRVLQKTYYKQTGRNYMGGI